MSDLVLAKSIRQQAPILITGVNGQIGGALSRLCARSGIAAVAPPRDQLDLLSDHELMDIIGSQKWSSIINCAAYTAVDQAEVEQDLAWKINARAPGIIAEASAKAGVPLIQLSTDYVFNGKKNGFYIESDPIDPLGIYGKTKAEGERAVQAASGSHAIIRTAWVLSAGPKNFLSTMLRLAEDRDEVRVVDDQHGCPTNASDIADAVLTISSQIDGRRGIWHCVNDDEASWYDLARHIYDFNRSKGLKSPKLVAIPSVEYPTLSPRPRNSRLSTARLLHDFGIKMRPWREAVNDILEQPLAADLLI